MKNFEERKAEIMLRADKQIKKRKQAQKRALTVGVSLCVCLCVTAGLFWMPPVQPSGSDLVPGAVSKADTVMGTLNTDEASGNTVGGDSAAEPADEASENCDFVESEEQEFIDYGPSCGIAGEEQNEAWIDAASQPYAVVRVQKADEAEGGLIRTECELLYTHRETVAGYPEGLHSGNTVEIYFPAAEGAGICAADELVVILSASFADGKACLQAAKDENGCVCILLSNSDTVLPPDGEPAVSNGNETVVMPCFAGLVQLNQYAEELEAGERTEAYEQAFPDILFSEAMTAKEAIAFLEQVNEALALLPS